MSRYSRTQNPPPIQIEGFALDEHSRPDTITSFSYNENTLTAHFNSLSFTDEQRTQFQWKLAGFDATWQPPRAERHVRYTHLPWGTYEFLVRARNARTAWSEPARRVLVIHPPFWGTWWFLSLSLVILVGGLLLLYSRRVVGLERETLAGQRFSRQLMELQEMERKRIAGEIHDSLVQNLLVAQNRTLLGIRNAAHPERVTTELSAISSALTNAIDEVREIAHNLRPYQLDRLGLTRALSSLAGKMSESSSTTFATEIENIDSLFTPETSTIVYRIVQESVNNILKHAGASEASISVRRTAHDVEVVIRDNGRGFPVNPQAPSHTHGFGLSGMEQRVKMLDGTLRIESAPDAGTTISIAIPVQAGHP
jgi:signal transduction histidine kinase